MKGRKSSFSRLFAVVLVVLSDFELQQRSSVADHRQEPSAAWPPRASPVRHLANARAAWRREKPSPAPCPLHSPPPSASSVRLVSLLVPPASAMDRERSSMSDRHQAPYCPIDHPGSFPTSHCLAMPPYPAVPLPVTRRRWSGCRGCRLNAWPRCLKLSQSKLWP